MAVVIDLYSRAVIGWSIQPHMKRSLICDALTMALWHRGFPRGVLCHSDRGSQYCSNDYQKMLNQHGLICSMSRTGNCWDNAVAESFFFDARVRAADEKRLAHARGCSPCDLSVHRDVVQSETSPFNARVRQSGGVRAAVGGGRVVRITHASIKSDQAQTRAHSPE